MGILRFIRKNWHIHVLFIIVAIFGMRNYTQNAYLTGWDNLQTELAPFLALKRAFFSVWEEYQSFGLIAGMAHAADIPRQLLAFVPTLILPQHFVRYFLQMMYIMSGAIGAFFLFTYSLDQISHKRLFALLASLVYIFNIGSVQILSLPFEAFSYFFAVLPWLILSLFILLDTKKPLSKKGLLIFIALQFFASSFAVSQQLFVVYGLVVGIIFLTYLLKNHSKQSFVRIMILGCLILICNLYWMLPQIEFLKTNGGVVQSSKINQLSTEDIYYRNLEKGTLDNFFFIKNFFLETVDKKNAPMLLPWLQWYEFIWTKIALYIITGIALLGIFSHKRHSLELKLLYGLFAILLLSNTPFFSSINDLIRSNRFINQIFRSPFTKFVVPYSLVFSFLFAEGLVILNSLLTYILKKYSPILIGLCACICIGVISYPAFDGYLYPKELKVSIPPSYHSAMTYFQNVDKNKRIALLPDYTYWGWFFNSWGYNGSGFLWYGVEQPIISHTFDVWSRESENYYWEIKQAIESEDPNLFQAVANKYNVSYFLLDKSLLPITSSAKGMQYDRLEKLMPKVAGVHRIEEWGNLVLFENEAQSKVNNFITISSGAPTIGPTIEQTNLDTAFEASEGYITKSNLGENDAIYPFLNLMSQTRLKNQDWKITENTSEFIIESLEQIDFSNYDIIIPKTSFSQTLYTEKGVASSSGSIYSLINASGHFTIRIPKILLRMFDPSDTEITNCGNVNGQIEVSEPLQIKTNNQASGCFGYTDATLDQANGYLTVVDSERIAGRSFLFYILDLTKKESVIEERLRDEDRYFIIPPRDRYGLGYNFSFQQNSYTGIASENKLNGLRVYTFPFSEIKKIYFVKNNSVQPLKVEEIPHSSKKSNYYSYRVSLKSSPFTQQITLHQSFHEGWKAYLVNNNSWLQSSLPFLFGTEIKDHVLVNNWANGWMIESAKTSLGQLGSEKTNIVIVFWPQYLEYLGFMLLVLTGLGVLGWKHKDKTSSSSSTH